MKTNTWKDNVGCAAVLLAIVLSTLTGLYPVFYDAAPVAGSFFTYA